MYISVSFGFKTEDLHILDKIYTIWIFLAKSG